VEIVVTSYYQYFDSPLGRLRLLAAEGQLRGIEFEGRHGKGGLAADDPHGVLADCARQLERYFSGERTRFTLSLGPRGTAFQQLVWGALRDIPYGELRSYRDIAQRIQRPRAVRAVGAANGRNPIPIVIPCHRVIGSDGSLTGFAGGLQTKRRLLQLEGALPPEQARLL
jgi:methylated-DNA-[protein]-cysteine S-methyltransferase